MFTIGSVHDDIHIKVMDSDPGKDDTVSASSVFIVMIRLEWQLSSSHLYALTTESENGLLLSTRTRKQDRFC